MAEMQKGKCGSFPLFKRVNNRKLWVDMEVNGEHK